MVTSIAQRMLFPGVDRCSNDHHPIFLFRQASRVEPQCIWAFFAWGWGWHCCRNLVFALRRGISLRSLGVGGFTPEALST
jgi:hypothetical protein